MTALEYVQQRKIVAIVRGLSPEYMVRLGHAFEEGGIGLMEVTYNQSAPETWKDTANAIEAVEKEFGDRLLVGAGTVIRPEQVAMTYNAGGHYLVTPTTQPEIIRMGKALDMGLFPGAFSPSEILAAWEAGADAVKVFPVSSVGPGYIKAVRGPLLYESRLRWSRCRREPGQQGVDQKRRMGQDHSPGKRICESGRMIHTVRI